MKFSAALSLAMAPVAFAKAVHNVYPIRRDPKNAVSESNEARGLLTGSTTNIVNANAALLAEAGVVLGSLSEVIILWVNGGGGVPTTTINAVQTVTQTVTAIANGAVVSNGAEATAVAGTTTTGTVASVVVGAGATHTVTVGGPKGLVYEPDSIAANVGDMVIFTFLTKNHTVTQSAFTTPCDHLAGGMDSGFQPNVNNSINPPPQVALQVMVDTPLWFYCRQGGHCGKGMTFSINPTASKTQALFQQMAIAQNGTGTGSAITGNGGTDTGNAAGGAVSSGTTTTETTSSLTATLGESSATSVANTGGTGLTSGTGTVNSDGSCSCAVVCNSGSFPAVQAQGIGAFGGFGGSVPMSAVALR